MATSDVRRTLVDVKYLLAVALLGALLAPTSGADAQDRRPCVSKVEVKDSPPAIRIRGAHSPRTPTRAELEELWDVSGLGVRDPALDGQVQVGFTYPACGYSFSEAQVWVIYNRSSHQALAIHRYVEPGATSRGHL